MARYFKPIITENCNVIMKEGKQYLLNQKPVGTTLKDANSSLAKLEKKQNREKKQKGYISTY